MSSKIKIINIMNHPPAYEEYSDKPRPEVNWDLPDGSWVGIWGYDWADILGENLMKYSKKFEYEVWQPDPRANKIYSHKFNSGYIHKLFPAKKKIFHRGFYLSKGWDSEALLSAIDRMDKNSTIFILNAQASYLEYKVLRKIKNSFPFLFLVYHNPKIFFYKETPGINFLKKLHRRLFYNYQKKYIESGKFLVGTSFLEDDLFQKTYKELKVYPLRWGLELNKREASLSKREAREILGIDNNILIFFSLCRLVEVKQIDKLIDIFSKFRYKNFLFFIAGHGTREYENFLKTKIFNLNLENKIMLVGYLSIDKIKIFFSAADVFISSSYSEGGPMSTFQAMLFELPIISTNTGLAAEFLNKHNAGILINNEFDDSWELAIEKVFNGDFPKVIDRETVSNFLDWSQIILEWEKIFNDVINYYNLTT